MSDIYLGNTEIEKAYIGDTLIYEKGSSAPYIVNPLNGGRFGPSINGQDGTFTYQYQVSGGTIADVCLFHTPSTEVRHIIYGSSDLSSYGKRPGPMINGGYGFPKLFTEVYGYTITLTCTYDGLITGVFTCDENEWVEGGYMIVVIIILTDGTKLVDTFIAPEGYIDW